MATLSKWSMLVPQPTNVVHNLIRNPGFEYYDAFFAGAHQYWWYYNAAGTIVTTAGLYPQQTTTWAALGQNSLACALDGTTYRHVEYSPRLSTLSSLGLSATVTLSAEANLTYTNTVYPIGNHYVAVFILTPYGSAVASPNPNDPQLSSSAHWIDNEGFNVMDLMRGRSAPIFSNLITTATPTIGGRMSVQISFASLPTEYDAQGSGLGYAIFWSRPGDTYPGSTERAWRCVTVKPASLPTTATITEYLPESDSTRPINWFRGATTFYTNATPTPFNTFYVQQEDGTLTPAGFINIDASQPSLALTPSGTPWNIGTTYSHHLYVEWYVDTNYTASTSPFIACAYDYAVTLIDNAGGTYTPVNYATGTNRLGENPTDRSTAVRTGRTKFLITPPDNSSTTNAGLDLRLRISIISPTGIFTGNAAILYIDNVQLVDIRYKSEDSLDWNDVEYTYLDGDVAGSQWEDFAPSYTSISGTAVNSIYPNAVWMGATNAGWGAAFAAPIRDRVLIEDRADVNIYGGTSYRGYAQSAMKTQSGEVGTFYPIDSEHLGADVSTLSTGAGMPEIATTTQQYGLVDGGLVQRQVANMRTMQLAITFTGSSLPDLHDKRRKVINALKFDQLAQQGDRLLRYSGSNTPVVFRVTYTAGLEFTGTIGMSFAEAATIQFICADPYVYSERPVSTRMQLTGYTQDTRTYLTYRQGDNQPWVYTGMKDYQDYTQGTGTINQTAAPVTVQSANGYIWCKTTATAIQMDVTAGSTTLTFSASFLWGDARDDGRPVYGKQGAGNIFLIGTIATFSSGTTAFLTAEPVGGTFSYLNPGATTTWWVGNKYVFVSSGILSYINFSGQYLTWGVGATRQQIIGKIVATGTLSLGITLDTYYIGSNLNTAAIQNTFTGVAFGSWQTVGTVSTGTTAAFTGALTAFNPPITASVPSTDVGKIVYVNPGIANPYGTISAVTTSTAISINTYVKGVGTISIAASTGGSAAVTGSGTQFTAADQLKLLFDASGQPLGIIATVTNATNIVLNIAAINGGGGYPLPVPAGTEFYLMSPTQATTTNFFLQTPQLNWSGGFFKYHMGFIQSPVSNSVSLIVGGFDNGMPTPGYGMSRYLSIINLDAKQNTSAGNYTNPTSVGVRNVTNNAFPFGKITTSTISPTVTANDATTFWPSDVGVQLYDGATYLGTIKSWDSPTQVTLWENAKATIAPPKVVNKLFTANVLNPDYSSVRPLLANHMTKIQFSNFYTLIPNGPITAMYQESATSVLIAGSFTSWNSSSPSATDISIIRVRGWERRGSSNADGVPNITDASNSMDIEIVAKNSTAGWGTPQIDCMTTDPLGNIYVGGDGFATSNVWYIGRANDGTYATIFQPLGALFEGVISMVTDTRFPVVNLYAGIESSQFLKIYPYTESRNSSGTWADPSTFFITLGTTSASIEQKPDGPIFQFVRTQSGDIIAVGNFAYWGLTLVQGIARFVPKISLNANNAAVVSTPAVPAGGSFSLPGIDDAAISTWVQTIADASYPSTSGAYAGTGERLVFGGYFDTFTDGRPSLGLGYLEGSGTASSVRRMVTSDMGLEPPTSSANYPVVQRLATTNRQRTYYANNQVNRTDNLVGSTIAAIVTQTTNSQFTSGNPLFRSGYGGSTSVSTTGVPTSTNVDVRVRGNANAYPIITIQMQRNTSFYEILQTETGARIRFDDIYGLRGVVAFTAIPEVITIDTRPGYRSVTSNLRGSLMQFVTPESNWGDFYLLAAYTSGITLDSYRINTLVFRYSTVTTVTSDTYTTANNTIPVVSIQYTPKFWSFDASKLFADSPDSPLI